MTSYPRIVTKEEFNKACEAVWTEFEYANALDIRTADEAKDVPGFLRQSQIYNDRCAVAWNDNAGTLQPDGAIQVEAALHGLRKLAAIAVRAMVYNGVRPRNFSVTPKNGAAT